MGRVAHRGSARLGLTSLAQSLFRWCHDHQVDLHIRWVPRALNSQADALSKISDSSDWRLNPRFFAILDKLWGPHTLDTFASAENTHCQKLFSKYRCPGAVDSDAFAFPMSRG